MSIERYQRGAYLVSTDPERLDAQAIHTRVTMAATDAAGDDMQRRFQELVERHLGSLLRFARRRSATLNDAEDAVQEPCLRAWMAFSELRDESKVGIHLVALACDVPLVVD